MNERTNEYAHLASASYDERLQVGKEVLAGGKKFEVIDSAKSLFTGSQRQPSEREKATTW